MLTHEKRVLACALLVEMLHGEQGPAFIAEQIEALALQGDEEAVAMWQQIAAAFGGLNRLGAEREEPLN